MTRTGRNAGKPILVTGATGYIGGLLVPRLLAEGHSVRCLVRDGSRIADREWASHRRLEIFEGDASDLGQLYGALLGCGSAYYLIHSMIDAGNDYEERDRLLARNFAEAAGVAELDRIVYLGGLGDEEEELSEHLRSRREVETILSDGKVPVTVLRAAMIIGNGSASFEILRHLVSRLPAMITPKWVDTEVQPIAVDDALHYLVACLDTPETTGLTLDIGGPDILNYREMMFHTARALGLRKRIIIPVPVFTPRLSSLWIHLVTPVSSSIAQPLALGLKNRVVCRDGRAHELMPRRRLRVREAIVKATLSTAKPVRPEPAREARPLFGAAAKSGGKSWDSKHYDPGGMNTGGR